jgi:hypothetical protein
VKAKGKIITKYRVRWKGYRAEDDSWLEYSAQDPDWKEDKHMILEWERDQAARVVTQTRRARPDRSRASRRQVKTISYRHGITGNGKVTKTDGSRRLRPWVRRREVNGEVKTDGSRRLRVPWVRRREVNGEVKTDGSRRLRVPWVRRREVNGEVTWTDGSRRTITQVAGSGSQEETNSYRQGTTGNGEVTWTDGSRRTITQVVGSGSQEGTNSYRQGTTGNGEVTWTDGSRRTITQVADRNSQDGTILTQVTGRDSQDGNGCWRGAQGKSTGVVQSKSLLRSRGSVKLVELDSGIGADLTGHPVPDSGTPRLGRNSAE